ncbi:MAG: DUF4249 domain-containing protein [Rhodothermales bacterium]|nr:DUF4249 domain-containing protein [Rhodothermales bacterium]
MTMTRLLPTALTLCLFASACVKTIPVDPGPYEEKIVIESLLLPGTVPTVYLNASVPFFDGRSTPSELFLRGASVIISSDAGADVLQPDSVYNRFWCRWEPFYRGARTIEADTEYRLEIELDGRTYAAETTTDVPAVEITGTDYVATFTDIYGGHEGVIVDFEDIAGERNWYRFRMDRPLDSRHETVDDFEYSSTCLTGDETAVVREFGRFVYSDDDVDGAPVRFVVEPAYTHYKGDTGTIYIQSLNAASAAFYDTLDRQREANINPFIEPVFLDSQIDGAIGVFGSANLSAPVEYVFPEDAG